MKFNFLLAVLFFSIGVKATERAQVADMSANLLLPDGTYLQVDVFTECALGGSNVGTLLFDDQHVELFAKGLDVSYGKTYGDHLRQAWMTKRNIDDPRLPTYIVVFKSGTETNEKTISKSLLKGDVESTGETDGEAPPEFIGNCGGSVHKPVGGG